jgi:hypothetical protein
MRTLLFTLTTCLAACALDPSADTGFEDPSVAEADTGEDPIASEKAASPGRLPQGLVCGLIYYLGTGASIENLYCEADDSSGRYTGTAYQTRSYGAISGYTRLSTGDIGRSSGQGYYHMDRNSNATGLYNSDSTRVFLPKGTACGLGHSANAPSETCMGSSTRYSCPTGWTRRTDDGSGGNYWYWCEYQDPYSTCTSSGCYNATEVPRGTVCGLGDNGASAYGTCLTRTVTGLGTCPSGWTFYGRNDYGAAAGYGLGWCAKNS